MRQKAYHFGGPTLAGRMEIPPDHGTHIRDANQRIGRLIDLHSPPSGDAKNPRTLE